MIGAALFKNKENNWGQFCSNLGQKYGGSKIFESEKKLTCHLLIACFQFVATNLWLVRVI